MALLLLCAAAPIAAHDEGQLSGDDADTVGMVVTAISES